MQLVRFGGIGFLTTFVHVAVALAASLAGLAPLAANAIGFLVAVSVSYLGHARVTFGRLPRYGAEAGRFMATALLGYAVSSLTVWTVEMRLGLGMGAAMAVVALTVPTASFLAMRFWVFSDAAPVRRIDATGLVAAALIAIGVTALFWGRMINHDTAWYLLATRDWLAGAALYVDLSEVNPPLNFYLTLPALGLADLFGLSDTNGQYLALGLMLFTSLAWSASLARAALDLPPARHLLLVTGLGAAMVLPGISQMGQREQILVILAMPWAMGQIAAAGGRAAILRALAAAVGICLKPHFLLFPIALTAWRVAAARSLRPVVAADNLTILVTGAAYVGYVALVHPGYFTDIVPMARAVYGAYGAPMALVIHAILPAIGLLGATALLAVRSPEAFRLSMPFWVLSAAGLGVYLAQGTGFQYHRIPFLAFGMAACIIMVVRARAISPGLLLAGLALAVLSAQAMLRGPYANPYARQIATIARDVPGLRSLLVLSSSVYVGPPAAMAAGADWASSYPSAWLVPGAVNGLADTDCTVEAARCDWLRAIAARNRADLLDDVAAHRPEVLVVDRRSGHFDRPGFDWLAFMGEDRRWADLFARYEKLAQTDRFSFYRLIDTAPRH